MVRTIPAWFLILLLGCGGSDGPQLAECSGSVVFNGQAISNADVTFFVDKSPIAIGTTDSSGAFSLKTGSRSGAPLGKAKVSISKSAESGTVAGGASMKPEEMQKMQMAAMSQKKTSGKSPIPSRYADPKSSNLTVEVTADAKKNVYDFQLVD